LADVRSLANALEEARRTGTDLGSGVALAPYARERYPANHLMLSMTDHLDWVFGRRGGVVDWVRGVGMEVVNELGPVKKALMEGAGAGAGITSGRAGDKVDEREFGRARAEEELGPRSLGWAGMAANGVEAMNGLRGVMGMAIGIAGDVARTGLRRAADALERR